MRTVVMSSESQTSRCATFTLTQRDSSTSLGMTEMSSRATAKDLSLADQRIERLFRSLNMTRFAIAWSTLPFAVMSRFVGRARRLPSLREATGSGRPTTYRRHHRELHFFRHVDPEQFQATLQDAPGQIAQRQPR